MINTTSYLHERQIKKGEGGRGGGEKAWGSLHCYIIIICSPILSCLTVDFVMANKNFTAIFCIITWQPSPTPDPHTHY